MEQMIIASLSSICLSLIASYIYDKIKNHSFSRPTNKSGYELDIKIKFKKK